MCVVSKCCHVNVSLVLLYNQPAEHRETQKQKHAACVMARYSSPDFPCEARRSPGGG